MPTWKITVCRKRTVDYITYGSEHCCELFVVNILVLGKSE